MIVTSRGLLFGGQIRAGDAVAVIVGGTVSRSIPTITGSWSLERNASGANHSVICDADLKLTL